MQKEVLSELETSAFGNKRKYWGYELSLSEEGLFDKKKEGERSDFRVPPLFIFESSYKKDEIQEHLIETHNYLHLRKNDNKDMHLLLEFFTKNCKDFDHKTSIEKKGYHSYDECYNGCLRKCLVFMETIETKYIHWLSLPLLLCAWYKDEECVLKVLPRDIFKVILCMLGLILTDEERKKKDEESKKEVVDQKTYIRSKTERTFSVKKMTLLNKH